MASDLQRIAAYAACGAFGDGGAVFEEEDKVEAEVAITGFAFRFPGGVDRADRLWEALAGREVVTEELGAEGRWGGKWLGVGEDHPRGTFPTRRFGVVRDSDAFDNSWFNLSEGEAKCMDRAQRQFLELTVEALHRSGIPVQSLEGSDAGVWVGCSTQETLAVLSGQPESVAPTSNPGLAQCVIANRVSFFLGCTGPSMAVDTACASTLTVLESAHAAIRSGRCDVAIVGGTNTLLLRALTIREAHYGRPKSGMFLWIASFLFYIGSSSFLASTL